MTIELVLNFKKSVVKGPKLILVLIKSDDNDSTIGVRQGDLSAAQRLGKIKYNLLSSLRARLGYILRGYSKPTAFK